MSFYHSIVRFTSYKTRHLGNSKTTCHLRHLGNLVSGYSFCAFWGFFRQCFVRKLRFSSKQISYSESALKTESIHICFKQFCEKYFFLKKIPVPPLRDGLVKNDNFFDNSAISWRILLIFELDRDIDETILCTKFELNRM